ncbi:MAG: ribonuclease P protein component [Candidatus Nealsonbacteria bacterium]|nr:ribonuclease P protein component [Candidatus Nealsonbacteria bacterium]
MLSKPNRLKKKKDFERVFKLGKTFKEDFLFFKIAKNHLSPTRFGFVVGKKVSKKAVVRNKIKRILGEIIRRNITKIKNGFDVVVSVDGRIKTKDQKSIEEVISKLIKKAKIIND